MAVNEDEWLLRAPSANPGMLEMFRLRDRVPVPQLVPWAGEFAGKYLISASQALRLGGGERLRGHLEGFVAGLLAGQAEDGYLGPFPRGRRLLGEWDLWGHYHVMQGLLRWHDETGDEAALAAVKSGTRLTLYVDGEPAASAEVPARIDSKSRLAAFGGNPLYTGAPEFLAADFRDARLYGRALSEREVSGLAERSAPGR